MTKLADTVTTSSACIHLVAVLNILGTDGAVTDLLRHGPRHQLLPTGACEAMCCTPPSQPTKAPRACKLGGLDHHIRYSDKRAWAELTELGRGRANQARWKGRWCHAGATATSRSDGSDSGLGSSGDPGRITGWQLVHVVLVVARHWWCKR